MQVLSSLITVLRILENLLLPSHVSCVISSALMKYSFGSKAVPSSATEFALRKFSFSDCG